MKNKTVFVLGFVLALLIINLNSIFADDYRGDCHSPNVAITGDELKNNMYLEKYSLEIYAPYWYKTFQDKGFHPEAPYTIYDSLAIVEHFPAYKCINDVNGDRPILTRREYKLLIDGEEFATVTDDKEAETLSHKRISNRFTNIMAEDKDMPENTIEGKLSDPLAKLPKQFEFNLITGKYEEITDSDKDKTNVVPFRLSWFANNDDGSSNPDNVEKLIDAIDKKKKFVIEVKDYYRWLFNSRNDVIKPISIYYPIFSVALTNCYHEYGGGSKKIVGMRGKSANYEPITIVNKISEVVKRGFKKYDPFPQNINKFSFYADLKKYDDSKFVYGKYGGLTKNPFSGLYPLSCKGTIYPVVYTNTSRAAAAVWVFINLGRLNPPIVFMHEFGHLFSNLNDEYFDDSYKSLSKKQILTVSGKNCVKDISYFKDSKGKLFGGDYVPCLKEGFIRPSENSIMNNQFNAGGQMFNRISCGYLMASINDKGSNKLAAEEYWANECSKMNVIMN